MPDVVNVSINVTSTTHPGFAKSFILPVLTLCAVSVVPTSIPIPLVYTMVLNFGGAAAMPSRSDGSYQVGDLVPWHFVPGIIVASFFASLIGTLLTVELLHRKRLGKSLVSRLVQDSKLYSESMVD